MIKAILFDWGNTLMKELPDQTGPMVTWEKVERVESAEECLKQLSPSYDCYLATNAKDSTKDEIRKALQLVQLDSYLKDIFCFQEIGFSKPSKQFYDAILKKLSVHADEVVVVGDNLGSDVVGALQNGIEAILFDPENASMYPGLRIRSLLEIESVLRTLP